MSRLATLKAATSLSDVAGLLGFKPKAVSVAFWYKLPDVKKYKTFEIPKRNGGRRTITAPIDRLKLLQRRLSDLLQDCAEEINIARNRKDRTAHGFKRSARSSPTPDSIAIEGGSSISIWRIFSSINFGRVRGFLIKNRDFELHEDVATVLAQISCHDHSLPQGSPCSPVISNLVAHLLDMRLVKLASSAGCTYSRDADDLRSRPTRRSFRRRSPSRQAVTELTPMFGCPAEAVRDVIERTGSESTARRHTSCTEPPARRSPVSSSTKRSTFDGSTATTYGQWSIASSRRANSRLLAG